MMASKDKIVYTLKKRKDTKEFHLFEAVKKDNDSCTPEKESICKMMNLSESEKEDNYFACQDADSARISCANKGEAVCGVCVSHLYKTYKK
jgi:sigma54-dependent transcription regulator